MRGWCCCFSSFCLADWTPSAPNPIVVPYSSFTYSGVFCSCDSASGSFLATWVDGNNNQYPTYTFFTPGAGWSPISTISNSSAALLVSNVATACNPVSGQFFASWTDSSTNQPTSSVYSPGMGWSAANALATSTAAVNTANCFDSSTGQFLVTWADTSNNDYPSYSFYTPGTGWGPVGAISTISRSANVYTSFDPTTNQFLAVWVDQNTGQPMYSFYSSGAWSVATSISPFASVDNDVLCACNPATGQFFATWADINQNLYPFYSVYTPGSGWSGAATITTSSEVIDNVTVSFDSATEQFLASWSDDLTGHPTYAFYTFGNGWSEPAIISTSSFSGNDIITTYNSMTGQFLATWADNGNPSQLFNPTYSFFTSAPLPPSYFTGKVMSNRFLTETDIIHRLMWAPPADSSFIVSYQIYRNGVSIAVPPASGPYVYDDHERSKNKTDLYTIVSMNADGTQSQSLSVVL